MNRLSYCVFIAAVLFLCTGRNASAQAFPESNLIDFCDLVRNPDKFDGKEVTVRASFRWGFEWQEIFCLNCIDVGSTRLEIAETFTTPVTMKILKKLPKNNGTVNAVFTGTFKNEGSMSSRYKFYLTDISEVKVIFKWGGHTANLPEKEKQKLCGGTAQVRKKLQ